MKRFFLFAGTDEPSGGAGDLIAAFDLFEEACSSLPADDRLEWAHVFDAYSQKVVGSWIQTDGKNWKRL